MNNYLKFGGLSAIVIGTLVWIAASEISVGSSYFKTLEEIEKLDEPTLISLAAIQTRVPTTIADKPPNFT